MGADDYLQHLFRRWQDACRQGRPLSVEELCPDCPELAEPLRRLIAEESPNGQTPATVVEHGDPSAPASVRESANFLDLGPGLEPVPGYRLVALLGRGSFGQVWKAIGPGGFAVALKCVRLGGTADAAEMRALEVIKDIRHANLLAQFGAWLTTDMLVIAMELADDTLFDRCNQCRQQGHEGIPREELREYMRDAAKGIDFLNEPRHFLNGKDGVGIQHRDIKPQNLLRVGGSVKVADFGLAKILQHNGGSNSGSMTAAYAAPECFKGTTSHRSDQYSLAVTYCQLRGGRLPFAGTSVAQIMIGHVTQDPDLSMLPPEERPAVARALAKEPDQRWPSCRAFVAALDGRGTPQEEFELVEAPEARPKTAPVALTPPGIESLPTLLPLPTSSRVARQEVAPSSRQRSVMWVWTAGLAGLVAAVGGLALGVMYSLGSFSAEHAAETHVELTSIPTVAPSSGPRPESTRPAPPTEKKSTEPVKPPPDPERERKEQAATQARMGREALARNEPEKALPLFIEAIRLDPENPAYHALRGRALFEMKDYARAIDALTEAIKRGDASATVYALRGRCRAELKKYEEAIEDFDRAISIDPKDSSLWSSRGTAQANLHKDLDKAIADFDESLRLNPRSTLTLRNRGVVYAQMGKYEKAVRDYTSALGIDPKYAPAYASRGWAYVHLNRREDALRDYDEAIKLDPNYVWAFNARGQLYSKHFRDFDKAIEDYTEAIRLNGQYVAAYENRAIAYDRMKDAKRAAEDRKKARELAEKMPAEPQP